MPWASCQSVGVGRAFSSGDTQSGHIKVNDELTVTLSLMVKHGSLFVQRFVV